MQLTHRCRRVLPFVLLTAVCAPAPADSGGREEVPADLILMQGKWELVDFAYYRSGHVDRPPRDQARGTRVVTGNRYRLTLTILHQQVDDDYTFRLYPNEQPKAFDVTMPDGRVVKGIYELTGDKLRRCYSQPEEPRPKQFKVGDQTYQEWRRVVEPPRKES
jgi:uncharacterized protein (TIGR03067 family)